MCSLWLTWWLYLVFYQHGFFLVIQRLILSFLDIAASIPVSESQMTISPEQTDRPTKKRKLQQPSEILPVVVKKQKSKCNDVLELYKALQECFLFM